MRRSVLWMLVCGACSADLVDEVLTPSDTELEDVWQGPGDPEDGAMMGITEAHNIVRRGVGVPDLEYSAEMARVSAEWLVHLEENEGCDIEHNWDSPLGENLYWATGNSTPEDVVESWASEVADYDYDTNSCEPGKQCGHYTQIVWSDTTIVGCAARRCASGPEIWMCNYDPAGNWAGRRPY